MIQLRYKVFCIHGKICSKYNLKRMYKLEYQASNASQGNCTVMLGTNVAYPQWIHVPCVERLLLNRLYCQKKNNHSLIDHLFGRKNESLHCQNNLQHILFLDKCVLIKMSFTRAVTFSKKSVLSKNHSSIAETISMQVMFGTGVHKIILSFGNVIQKIAMLEENIHYWKDIEPNQEDVEHVLMIQEKDSFKPAEDDAHLFWCLINEYISSVLACDNHIDCSDGTDERFCPQSKFHNASHNSIKPHQIKDIQNKDIFFYDSAGQIRTYISAKSTKSDNGSDFRAFFDHSCHVLDLEKMCLSCGQVNEYFLFHASCIFQKSTGGVVGACSNGFHLERCRYFNCSLMFACPHYYCLPWRHVCDGEWDCPNGMDESTALFCRGNRLCTDKFKCRKSSICIGIADTCNSIADCPLHDDELLCQLKSVICPVNCSCLNLALSCFNAEICDSDEAKEPILKPFVAIVIISSSKINIEEMLKRSTAFSLVLLRFVDSNTGDCLVNVLCRNLAFALVHLRSLNVSSNNFSNIPEPCSDRKHELSVFIFTHNKIQDIKANSFQFFTQLMLLDLSDNLITSIHDIVFKCLDNLSLLNMPSNPLSDIHRAFQKPNPVKTLKVNEFYLCCSLPHKACSVERKWFSSCSDLLPHLHIKIISWAIAVAVLILAAVSCLVQLKFSKGSYLVSVLGINFSDYFYSVYMFIISSSDIYFRGKFGVVASRWQKSILCYIAAGLSLTFCILSCFSLSLLAFVRQRVITQTFESKYVSKKHALKRLVAVFCTIPLLVVASLTSFHFTTLEFPSQLCNLLHGRNNNSIEITTATIVTSFLQICCSIFIPVLHVLLFREVKRSRKKVASSASKCTSLVPTIVQLCVVTLSNILCWIPSSIVHILSIFLPTYPHEMLTYITIVVTPLNSILNPVVFCITSREKIHNSLTTTHK